MSKEQIKELANHTNKTYEQLKKLDEDTLWELWERIEPEYEDYILCDDRPTYYGC